MSAATSDRNWFSGRRPTLHPAAATDVFDIAVPDWMADGLCAQTDPELFFPGKGGSTREAKRICAACPVRDQCLEYALADERTTYVSPFYYGIWGGLSERERRKLKTAQRRAE